MKVLALALLCAVSTVNGFGSGAPDGVCSSMTPGHRATVSTTPFPYKVVLSKTTVTGSDTVDITITSQSGDREFKGFILQVRKPGEDKAYGEFNDEFENDIAQTLNCFDKERSAITHANNAGKKSVTAEWTAPNEDAEYVVVYTIVGSGYGEFWKPQTHEQKITVTSGSRERIDKQRKERSQFTVY